MRTGNEAKKLASEGRSCARAREFAAAAALDLNQTKKLKKNSWLAGCEAADPHPPVVGRQSNSVCTLRGALPPPPANRCRTMS